MLSPVVGVRFTFSSANLGKRVSSKENNLKTFGLNKVQLLFLF